MSSSSNHQPRQKTFTLEERKAKSLTSLDHNYPDSDRKRFVKKQIQSINTRKVYDSDPIGESIFKLWKNNSLPGTITDVFGHINDAFTPLKI